MKQDIKCICGNDAVWHGICAECKELLIKSGCKNLMMFERIRENYNMRHNTYKTYGQFVAFIETISRRKKEFDNTRKKAIAKKIWGNR